MTLKPGFARRVWSSPSSGTAMVFSERIEIRASWTSGGQRVSSSKRTMPPDLMAWNTGEGTRARALGPSASSRA